MGEPAKLLWEMMEENQNLTALSSEQVNDVQIWQICTQKLGMVDWYLLTKCVIPLLTVQDEETMYLF